MKASSSSPRQQRGFAGTWMFVGFASVALFFLLAEHRAHLYGWLPFILLAACPLMHFFHGHGGHGSHEPRNTPRRGDDVAPTSPAKQTAAPAPAARHHH